MLNLRRKDKNKIVASIRDEFSRWHAKAIPEVDIGKACLWWAVFAQNYFKKIYRFKAHISAGSMSWPIVRADQWPDTGHTHFSYQFDPAVLKSRQFFEGKIMPEMHVWVILPERKELVDLTTCYLKYQCETHQIYDPSSGQFVSDPMLHLWKNDGPPEYLWCRIDDIPKNVHYVPHPEAVRYVAQLCKQAFGEKDGRA